MVKKLREGLKINKGNIISFIGAGGKTSSLVHLVREMEYEKLIIVTTTHFFGFKQFKNTEVLISEGPDLLQRIENIWHNNPLQRIVIGKKRKYNIEKKKEIETDYKIAGVEEEKIKILNNAFPQAIILIEADGANRKQIKAPAKHEPVVPQITDIIVPVVGMSPLGKKVDNRYCHRVEEILKLSAEKKIITEELVVKILTSKKSYGIFNKDNNQSYIPVLNQVNDKNMKSALQIANKLKKLGIERVLLTDTWREDPLLRII